MNINNINEMTWLYRKIDQALMRKGRLIGKYEFRKPEVEKSQRLSDSLGYSNLIRKEMSLSEIYNQDQKEFTNNVTSPIGFVMNKIPA